MNRFSGISALRAMEQEAQAESFTSELVAALGELLRPFVRSSAEEFIQDFERAGRSFFLREEDSKDDLRFWFESPAVGAGRDCLVVFEVLVSALFGSGGQPGSDAARSSLLGDDQPEANVGQPPALPPTGLPPADEKLQSIYEVRLCNALRPPLVAFVDELNTIGNQLVDVGEEPPEITFRDEKSGLLVGIYCVATINVED